MPTLASSIEQSADHLSQSNLDRKKGIQIGKKEVKLYPFSDDMILHVALKILYTHTC